MNAQAYQGGRIRPLPRLRDPFQQTCKMCGQPDKFNFDVPDDVWRSVVPLPFQRYVVCLYCFDEEAAARGIHYAAAISGFCFVGQAGRLYFDVKHAADG